MGQSRVMKRLVDIDAAPTPVEVVAVVDRAAPHLPRTRAPRKDKAAMLSMRFRASSLAAIAEAARAAGVTQKVFVASALLAAGVRIARADLVDGSPPRR